MDIEERKKLFFGVLDLALIEQNYRGFKSGGDPTYVLKNDKIVISFFFNFFSAGDIGGGVICLTHNEVEEYILKVRFPNYNFEKVLEGDKYFLPTVCDGQVRNCIKNYLRTTSVLGEEISKKSIMKLETPDQVTMYATCFLKYLETEGAAFIKHYSHLPNILTEMDRLEAEGSDWNGILSGMGDRLFRGIIISRLCNDPNFLKKLDYCETKFTTVQLLREWQPYWEKLKAILPTIEPKYNLIT